MNPRELRKMELQSMMHGNQGYILARYKQVCGMPQGASPPVGTLVGEMIEAILNHEFPPQDPGPVEVWPAGVPPRIG